MIPTTSSRQTPPPAHKSTGSNDLPIMISLKGTYLLWHSFFNHLPRHTRFTLGSGIDGLFADILALTLTAQYIRREDKRVYLQKLSSKVDELKFFMTVLWETKGISTEKFGQLSGKLSTAGKMLGKWLQSMEQKTPG